MKKKILFMSLVIVLLIAACMPSQEQIDQIINSAQQTALAQITVVAAPTQDVNQIVQATFQALTAQAVTATPVPGDSTGGISGKLSYPSEGIPPLLVVAFNVDTGDYFWVLTQLNRATYQIDDLPVGVYHVAAYLLPDGQMVGGYDQFYLCGMHQGCNDSALVDVSVQAGAITPNIDPGNWYSGPENFPPMPAIASGQNPATDNIPTFVPAGGVSGSITGKLSYPSSFIPSMAIVAYVAGGSPLDYYYMITDEGSSTYQLDNLPPGNYYVVAYLGDGGFAGGYSQAIPCGLSAECADHSLISVPVTGGQVTQGVDPGDWYAPSDAFPPYPLP